jgi:hypothetical protein
MHRFILGLLVLLGIGLPVLLGLGFESTDEFFIFFPYSCIGLLLTHEHAFSVSIVNIVFNAVIRTLDSRFSMNLILSSLSAVFMATLWIRKIVPSDYSLLTVFQVICTIVMDSFATVHFHDKVVVLQEYKPVYLSIMLMYMLGKTNQQQQTNKVNTTKQSKSKQIFPVIHPSKLTTLDVWLPKTVKFMERTVQAAIIAGFMTETIRKEEWVILSMGLAATIFTVGYHYYMSM